MSGKSRLNIGIKKYVVDFLRYLLLNFLNYIVIKILFMILMILFYEL